MYIFWDYRSLGDTVCKKKKRKLNLQLLVGVQRLQETYIISDHKSLADTICKKHTKYGIRNQNPVDRFYKENIQFGITGPVLVYRVEE
jgi:hypothetical protein